MKHQRALTSILFVLLCLITRITSDQSDDYDDTLDLISSLELATGNLNITYDLQPVDDSKLNDTVVDVDQKVKPIQPTATAVKSIAIFSEPNELSPETSERPSSLNAIETHDLLEELIDRGLLLPADHNLLPSILPSNDPEIERNEIVKRQIDADSNRDKDILIFDYWAPTVQRFRTDSQTTEVIDNFQVPSLRVNPSVLVTNNKLYYIGGNKELEYDESRRVDIYDIATGNWSLGPELHIGRTLASGQLVKASNGDVMIVICGCRFVARMSMDHYDRCQQTCEVLNTTNPTEWIVQPINIDSCNLEAAGVAHSNSYYLTGGYCRPHTQVSQVLGRTNEWESPQFAPLLRPRWFHGIASDGQYIYVCGGYNPMDKLV